MHISLTNSWSLSLAKQILKKRNNPLYKDFTIALAKSPSTLSNYHDWMSPWIKERVNYISCIEGKGGMKDIWYFIIRPGNCSSIIKSLLYLPYNAALSVARILTEGSNIVGGIGMWMPEVF